MATLGILPPINTQVTTQVVGIRAVTVLAMLLEMFHGMHRVEDIQMRAMRTITAISGRLTSTKSLLSVFNCTAAFHCADI